MATGRELKNYLDGLSDKELDLIIAVTGHYGEAYELDLPMVKEADKSYSDSTKIQIIEFEHIDIGPEPD